MEDRREDRWEGRMEGQWEDRMEGHWGGRMEGHWEDRWGALKGDPMEERMEEPRRMEEPVGWTLCLPALFLRVRSVVFPPQVQGRSSTKRASVG